MTLEQHLSTEASHIFDTIKQNCVQTCQRTKTSPSTTVQTKSNL